MVNNKKKLKLNHYLKIKQIKSLISVKLKIFLSGIKSSNILIIKNNAILIIYMQELSLKSFDNNPASINLNYNKIQQYRSNTGGLFSLCYIIIALVIIVFKLIDLIERNHVTYVQIVTKQNDQTPLDISSGKFRLFFYELLNGKPHKILFADRFKRGINVSIIEYNIYIKNSQNINMIKQFPMVECPEQYGYQHLYHFCSPPPNKQTNGLNYSIFGRVDFPVTKRQKDQNPYRQYSFVVQPCDKNVDDSCMEYKNDLSPFFQFSNNKINPNIISHNETIVKSIQKRQFQTRVPLKINDSIDMELDFQKVIIRTENSILPQIFNRKNKDFEESTTWFFDEEINQFYSLPHPQQDTAMLNVQIRRSIYTREYVRKYMKLDFVLAEIFGLFGLFSLIFYGVYRGYNEYSLEQNIRKDLGLPYDQNTNIFKYYRFKIKKIMYKWFSFCLKNKQEYKQQQRSMLKINKKFDVSTLRHKKKSNKIK